MNARSNTVVLTPPAAEPCSITELTQQLGIAIPAGGALDPGLAGQLTNLLLAARHDVEGYLRRALILQTRQMQLNRFPREHREYTHRHRPGEPILLPAPPLMAIVSVTYTDLTGSVQTLPYDGSFGTAANLPPYTYQRSLGTETQPGRIEPGRYRYWPWAWEGENLAQITFRCGYNGPVTVTTTAVSAAITSPFGFLPDDVGRPISIPGVGVNGTTLQTAIAGVDGQGNATLATAASLDAANVTATFGVPVPEPIRQAILIRAESYYTKASMADDADIARICNRYRNLVS